MSASAIQKGLKRYTLARIGIGLCAIPLSRKRKLVQTVTAGGSFGVTRRQHFTCQRNKSACAVSVCVVFAGASTALPSATGSHGHCEGLAFDANVLLRCYDTLRMSGRLFSLGHRSQELQRHPDEGPAACDLQDTDKNMCRVSQAPSARLLTFAPFGPQSIV